MPSQETIRLALGEVEIPLDLVTALLKRHILRTIRGTTNGHSPRPTPDHEPEEAAAPVLPSSTGAP